MVGTISDVDGTNKYQPPPGGGELIGNTNPADSLTLQDMLLGWQPGQPQGYRTRNFLLAQILDLFTGSFGGPFLPLNGGTIAGPLTVTGPLTAGAVAITGQVTFPTLASGPSYDNDTQAAAGGVAVGSIYRNGNFVMVRLT